MGQDVTVVASSLGRPSSNWATEGTSRKTDAVNIRGEGKRNGGDMGGIAAEAKARVASIGDIMEKETRTSGENRRSGAARRCGGGPMLARGGVLGKLVR
mmetsp:Transcript_34497/g.63766  ORF Transcript_34497/g.63766 Transcript_34497/m.63766 type:complete len:99 (-) Transcript_34497:37-333(-)